MSTKGMSVVAARQLIEQLSLQDVTILVIRDFDKDGFSIVHTLQSDTRRYVFWSTPNVVDLGLRLSDVESMGLESELVRYRGRRDPRYNLRASGATEAECDFLVEDVGYWGSRGRRVELNAMTSDQLIGWLLLKLEQQGVAKVVPAGEFLEDAYRHSVAIRAAQRVISRQKQDVQIPEDLARRVREMIDGDEMAWDDAVWEITAEHEGAARH